jgi:hypothetical protein
MIRTAAFLVPLCLLAAAPARAATPSTLVPPAAVLPQPRPAAQAPAPLTKGQATMCQIIETAAHENDLPPEFLARLLWQESSFDANAVSWAGAQGIAQFMPPTASDRGLADPFDPAEAIPASAAFLRELRAEFGNLGLAAAAYNAGPTRLANWLGGTGFLPFETQAYVRAITGYTVDQWAAAGTKPKIAGSEKSTLFPLDCTAVVAKLRLPGGRRVVRPRVIAPWGVVVSGAYSRKVAFAAFEALRRRHPVVLGGIDPLVMGRRMRGRGFRPFYQVRLPAGSRSAANALCGRLQRAGGSCVVLRN